MRALSAVIAERAFTDVFTTPVLKAKCGDSSGVRGAAWLWPRTHESHLPRLSVVG